MISDDFDEPLEDFRAYRELDVASLTARIDAAVDDSTAWAMVAICRHLVDHPERDGADW